MSLGFNVPSLNQALNNLSQEALWEQASLCPCKSPRTGGADPACPVCGGNAIMWDAAVKCRVGLQGMKTGREFAMFTQWEKGDILASIPSDSKAYDAGEYDRFTLIESTLRLDQILKKGSDDKLKYTSIISVENVWGIVSGARVDLVQGVDFTLAGAQLTWLTNALPTGQQYTITYFARPQYYVFRDLVTDRPHGSKALPRKVHMRLMELFNRSLVN